MDPRVAHQLLHRSPDANKYDFGHVLIVGGSAGMVGAPLMAGEAALRVGAGLVTIASEATTTEKLERRVEEIMTISLDDFTEVDKVITVLQTHIVSRHVTALLVGSGLPPSAHALVRAIAEHILLPLVIDAGGLGAFYDNTGLATAATKNASIILTPHTGEFAKLAHTAAKRDPADLRQQAKNFAQTNHVTLVVKGHKSLIIDSDGHTHVNQTGNPGLATAGTGDILAGMIAGLLAQGSGPFAAAQAATYLHGLAGDLAAKDETQAGVIATDLLDYVPAALKTLM